MENESSRNELRSLNLVDTVLDEIIDLKFVFIRSRYYRRIARAIMLIVVTWVPIAVLSLLSGHAFAGVVSVPLLHDPSVYGRFLFVLPLLEIAQLIVAIGFAVQAEYFVESDIVPQHQRIFYHGLIKQMVRLRSSIRFEIVLAVFVLAVSLIITLTLNVHGRTSWQHNGTSTTLAGWWYALVSRPILLFFLLRWFCIFCLWSWFLFRVSRLDLDLTPTHPDHAGGLGFLGWGLVSFSTVLMAVSTVFSAGFAFEIIHGHESLDSLKFHIVVFVVLAVVVLYAPLLAFSGRLSRCRFTGLLNYSSLVLRHDRAFDKKWIEDPHGEKPEPLLGSADIQSLADIATAYEHVYDMKMIPFDVKAFAIIVVAILLPMAPLVATQIPLDEIFKKLLELMA